jgi:hypothetical protein
MALLMRIALLFIGCATFAAVAGAQAQSLAPLPSGWPKQVELGMADAPGGAAAMKGTAPFAFRYQYLAGGVNTGNGWANWDTNGDFARFYIQDSAASGIIPVFTCYMLLQSAPGGGSESNAQRPQVVLSESGRVSESAGRAARRARLVGIRRAGVHQRRRRHGCRESIGNRTD